MIEGHPHFGFFRNTGGFLLGKLFYQGLPIFAFCRSCRANMKIVKKFSLIKVAISTQFFDIIPWMCGFKCLRCLIIQPLVGPDLIVKRNCRVLHKLFGRRLWQDKCWRFWSVKKVQDKGRWSLCDHLPVIAARNVDCVSGLQDFLFPPAGAVGFGDFQN